MTDEALELRPVPKPKGERIHIRADADEIRAFRLAATLADLSYSDWIRKRLRAAASTEIHAAGKAVPFEKKR